MKQEIYHPTYVTKNVTFRPGGVTIMGQWVMDSSQYSPFYVGKLKPEFGRAYTSEDVLRFCKDGWDVKLIGTRSALLYQQIVTLAHEALFKRDLQPIEVRHLLDIDPLLDVDDFFRASFHNFLFGTDDPWKCTQANWARANTSAYSGESPKLHPITEPAPEPPKLGGLYINGKLVGEVTAIYMDGEILKQIL
jgi:hypothetical protein